MEELALKMIQGQIGYSFKNVKLLEQAFVRRTYSKENGGEDNEVLEFIGDTVLGFVVVRNLAQEFGHINEENEYVCDGDEGELTRLKVQLVEKQNLARRMDELGLSKYLVTGKSDNITSPSVKEDLFEAIIGAVAIDSGWDWDEIRSSVEYMLKPEIHLNNDDNYVEMIQEWSLKRCGELPSIEVTNSSYDDENTFIYPAIEIRSTPKRDYGMIINSQEYYRTHFKCELCLNGINKKFIGYGGSKNEARKDACKLACDYLDQNDMLFSIQNEIANPNKAEAISQLEILARRGYFSVPKYFFEEQYDSNGNLVWRCVCHIKEIDFHPKRFSSSKKEAKKSAAFEMLKFVLLLDED